VCVCVCVCVCHSRLPGLVPPSGRRGRIRRASNDFRHRSADVCAASARLDGLAGYSRAVGDRELL